MANVCILISALLVVGLLEYVDLGETPEDPFDVFGAPTNSRKKRQADQTSGALETLLDNIKAIEDHNLLADVGDVTFRMKLNKFAHEAPEIFNKLRNGFRLFSRANPIPDGLKAFVTQALKFAGPIFTQITGIVDWRFAGADWLGWLVWDQEECASCWAFSTIGAIEAQIIRSTGRTIYLSQQNLIDCAKTDYGGHGCNGGSMVGAYKYIRDNGVNTAISYPYEAKDGICRHDPTTAVRLNGYRKIEEGNETQLMEAVATVGPVAAGMDASLRSFQFYSRGVYYDPLCSSTNLNHGVLVMGYGTTTGGMDYWVVKNSYGPDWGEGGYFRIARNKGNHCGIATLATYPIL
uniref:Cathepsin L n=1 Tax=Lygus hesperus TaxID=30085 RepID=A0A146M8L0_LYGHE